MIIPSLLTTNDKVHIISPSGKLPPFGLDEVLSKLKSWGLELSLGKHTYSSDSVFSGTDEQRLSDFQTAINDESVKLILCARGGYGLTRYIDQLDLIPLKDNPKWIVGFSDITALHLKAIKLNILTIHGPVGTSFSQNGVGTSIRHLHKLLFSGYSEIQSKKAQLKPGVSEGEIIGGNLSLICESLGTPTEIETNNKILVLEDVGDYYYRIDRMLNQLARAGKFNNLKGLVIGSFNELENGSTVFTESVNDMISRLTYHTNYPIATAMPIGHTLENFSFVHGASYKLSVADRLAKLELQTIL